MLAVVIGPTSPGALLSLYANNSGAYGYGLRLANASAPSPSSNGEIVQDGNPAGSLYFGYGPVGSVTSKSLIASSNGAYSSLSDINLKTEIEPLVDALTKTQALRGVSFRWKDLPPEARRDVGVIAQDVEKVLPEAVTVRSDGKKMVAYTILVPLLIEAIKELKLENDSLGADLKALRRDLCDRDAQLSFCNEP